MSQSPFIYLLNAFEEASQADEPAKYGYGERRRKLIEYVTKLERAWAVKFDREKEAREDARSTAAEAVWKERQGEDREQRMLKALHMYDEAMSAMSFYVGHTYGRVGEQAHAHAVEQCELAAKAQKILDSFDPPKEPR